MTCQILVNSPNGATMRMCALLDSASSTSFIFERLAQSLHLPRMSQAIWISGIAGFPHQFLLNSITEFTISATSSPDEKIPVSAIVVPHVTSDTSSTSPPQWKMESSHWITPGGPWLWMPRKDRHPPRSRHLCRRVIAWPADRTTWLPCCLWNKIWLGSCWKNQHTKSFSLICSLMPHFSHVWWQASSQILRSWGDPWQQFEFLSWRETGHKTFQRNTLLHRIRKICCILTKETPSKVTQRI